MKPTIPPSICHVLLLLASSSPKNSKANLTFKLPL